MKRALIISLWLIISFFIASVVFADDTYYARCNIKVLKGNQISWVNWQAAPHTIPAGTKLKVTRSGKKATFVREDNGKNYKVDLGADGDVYLDKFVTKKPVNIRQISEGRTIQYQ